jgi:hypothetical protein
VDPAAVLRFVDVEKRDRAKRRDGFQEVIRQAQAGKIRRIAISRFDRFGSKGPREFCHYTYLLEEAKCRLVDASTGKDLIEDDLGTDIMNVVGATASAREQVEKGMRSLQGKNRRAKESACWNGGTAPFGFDRCCLDSRGEPLWFFCHESRSHGVQVFPCDCCRTTPRGLTGNKPCGQCRRVACSTKAGNMPCKNGRAGESVTLIPSERQERIDAVRQIFEWFTTRAEFTTGVAALCRKAGMTLYGRRFAHETIKQIISNPAVVGTYAFGRKATGRFAERDGEVVTEMAPDADRRSGRPGKRPIFRPGEWVGLVDRATFDKAQRKLAGHKGKPRPPRSKDAWLKGILHCEKCRKPMKPNRRRGRVMYCCRSRYYADLYGNPSGCGFHHVAHDAAEKLIRDKLDSLKGSLTDPDERRRVLALYAAKGRKLDDIAKLVKDGALEFADLLLERFGGDPGGGRLGEMISEFKSHFALAGADDETLLDFALHDTIFLAPTDEPGVDEVRVDAAAVAGLMQAIEEEAAACAGRRLAKAKKDLKAVFEAKFQHNTSDRERDFLDEKRVALENEMDTLEQHAVPLGERHAKIMDEVNELAAKIAAADDPLADSDPMRKHEAVRNILGRVYLHFRVERQGRRTRSVLLPEKTEFECAPTAGSSGRAFGTRPSG